MLERGGPPQEREADQSVAGLRQRLPREQRRHGGLPGLGVDARATPHGATLYLP